MDIARAIGRTLKLIRPSLRDAKPPGKERRFGRTFPFSFTRRTGTARTIHNDVELTRSSHRNAAARRTGHGVRTIFRHAEVAAAIAGSYIAIVALLRALNHAVAANRPPALTIIRHIADITSRATHIRLTLLIALSDAVAADNWLALAGGITEAGGRTGRTEGISITLFVAFSFSVPADGWTMALTCEVVTNFAGGEAVITISVSSFTLFAGFLNSVTATGRRPTLTVGAADQAATGRTSAGSVALFAAVYYSISAEGGTATLTMAVAANTSWAIILFTKSRS